MYFFLNFLSCPERILFERLRFFSGVPAAGPGGAVKSARYCIKNKQKSPQIIFLA